MEGALIACGDCGFVTRRHSRIGVSGECPHCGRALTPVSFPAARRLLLRKQGVERVRPPLPPASDQDSQVSP